MQVGPIGTANIGKTFGHEVRIISRYKLHVCYLQFPTVSVGDYLLHWIRPLNLLVNFWYLYELEHGSQEIIQYSKWYARMLLPCEIPRLQCWHLSYALQRIDRPSSTRLHDPYCLICVNHLSKKWGTTRKDPHLTTGRECPSRQMLQILGREILFDTRGAWCVSDGLFVHLDLWQMFEYEGFKWCM
jgi:hypothetical protein